MHPFANHIESIARQLSEVETYAFEPPSPFPVFHVPQLQLLLQPVAVDAALLKTLSPDFFARQTDIAALKGLQLIHIWEDQWLMKNEIVQSRIAALLGASRRIHGRSTTVKRTDKKTSEPFLNQNHLQGYTNAYYKYALTFKDEVVALALFSKARVMHDGVVPYRSFELVRYASLKGCTVTGGLGKLIRAFIADMNPSHLMTYADRDWGAGSGYRKLGFVFSGNTDPICFYIHPKEMIRWYPHRLPPGFENEDEMDGAGYVRIYNAGNSKFILDRRKT